MADALNYIAVDLGAESGRVLLAKIENDRLTLEEVHRFANTPVRVGDSLHWNTLQLWSDIKRGICDASNKVNGNVAGVGVDTWGVDFGLLDKQGRVIGFPYHYRDSRTNGMLEAAFKIVPKERIFEQTGVQFMQLNTLYQLLSMVNSQSPMLEIADTFLTMPDLLNYWLTGVKVCEFSNATTTQCFDPRTRQWAKPLLVELGIPTHIFPEIVSPGTKLGTLSEATAQELGISPMPVIAPACHDTGSAVAAVPASNRHFAYISSGTWSLVGVEAPEPVINEKTLAYNFTNEGGVGNTFRLLKNVMGLWLVQECRREWQRKGDDRSYAELAQLAQEAKPFTAFVDPDDPRFLPPGDMPQRILDYCKETGQPEPEGIGGIIRCALESLALKYRWVLNCLHEITGFRPSPVHMVGGGCQNLLLCQFAANATGEPVITGPIEATAIGNALMQAIGLSHIGSVSEGRELVRRSFDVAQYEPQAQPAWQDAYGRFLQVTKL